MILKVQLPNRTPSKHVIVQHGFPKEGEIETFHAWSDDMKARILERMAYGEKFILAVCDESEVFREGSWWERPIN